MEKRTDMSTWELMGEEVEVSEEVWGEMIREGGGEVDISGDGKSNGVDGQQ